MWVVGDVPRHEITVFLHFGHDQSSPGLTLVPTGIIKTKEFAKKAVKMRKETNKWL